MASFYLGWYLYVVNSTGCDYTAVNDIYICLFIDNLLLLCGFLLCFIYRSFF